MGGEEHAVDRGSARLGQDPIGHRRGHALISDQHDRRDRLGHIGGVRLDRLAPDAAHDRPAPRLDAHVALVGSFLHQPAGGGVDREAVVELDPAGVDDEGHVVPVEREVVIREHAEEATGRVER